MRKCLLCGAVFAASALVCPVCGAGPEQFAALPASHVAFRKDTDALYMILGGGVAGLSAAEAIRERNHTCRIVLITDEETPPYHRPMLTKAMGAEYAQIAMRDADFYQAHAITVLTGKKVTRLFPDARMVELSDGAQLAYDACVLALGASSFIPPIEGVALPEVCALRSLSDARRISGLVASGRRRAVVVGGGVLGLEAAWGLKQGGCEVCVLEMGEGLMRRQLDAEASAMLASLCEAAGVRVRTGATTEAIWEADGHVSGVRLRGGEVLPADLVLLSSGVRANTALAKEAGLSVSRGIVVDERMRTGFPGLYACGDCAEMNGACIAIWPAAAEMGRVAGANAAADDVAYSPVSLGISFQGMGTALYALGDVGGDGEEAYRMEVKRDDAKGTLDKRYFRDGALCGAILIGDIGKAQEIAERLTADKG